MPSHSGSISFLRFTIYFSWAPFASLLGENRIPNSRRESNRLATLLSYAKWLYSPPMQKGCIIYLLLDSFFNFGCLLHCCAYALRSLLLSLSNVFLPESSFYNSLLQCVRRIFSDYMIFIWCFWLLVFWVISMNSSGFHEFNGALQLYNHPSDSNPFKVYMSSLPFIRKIACDVRLSRRGICSIRKCGHSIIYANPQASIVDHIASNSHLNSDDFKMPSSKSDHQEQWLLILYWSA